MGYQQISIRKSVNTGNKLSHQVVHSAPTLTLDIKHSLHADLWHAFFAEFGSDAKHLICIGGHYSYAAFVQLSPRHWPLPSHFFHTLDNLKNLHTQV